MAYATQLTLTTGNKVSINFQSQEVNVSLTYQLEREDTDVLAVVSEKTAEVEAAHRLAWQGIHHAKVNGQTVNDQAESCETKQPVGVAVETGVESPSANPSPEGKTSEDETEVYEPATIGQCSALNALLAHLGWSDEQREEQLNSQFDCTSLEELTCRQASQWLLELQRGEREKAAQRRLQAAKLNGKS